MSKAPPPLLGFNNNVKHRGRIFHIQTEDSGVKSPRIVTHLFADGGRIVKTTRTDYAEHVGRDDMMPVVRRIMKEQHKGMFIALRAGELDDLLEQICGPHPEAPPAPKPSIAEPALPSSVVAAMPPPPPPETTVEMIAASAEPPSLFEVAERVTPVHGTTIAEAGSERLSNPSLYAVAPSPPPTAPTSDAAFDAAVGALEAATAPDAVAARAGAQAQKPRRTPPIPKGTPVHGTPAKAGRYAPSRPSAIFSSTATPEKQSIFGESVITEQSLDEVILSYLAEDLEDQPKSR